MATETIDHTTLAQLVGAGVVRSAHVVGQDGGWGVLVKSGTTECVLAAQRSHKMRVFRRLETLVDYLKCIGIPCFEVDARNYIAHSIGVAKRPDRAAAMKDVHAAAAYTKWFKAEVQKALDDTSPTISHDEALRLVRAVIKFA